MARERLRRGWRPKPKRGMAPKAFGVWTSALFNLSLVALPLAAAIALCLIVRDNLFTYPLNDGSARGARAELERVSADLIQLDFDRRRQWDDLIAMELMDRDIAAARGFLLSGRTMLSSRDQHQLDRSLRSNAGDAEIEIAALELVTPGTRARYESMVPLLSRYSDAARRRDGAGSESLGDARDFELLAQAALGDPSADASRFALAGLGLGLGEELTPRERAGALALVNAMRRTDFSADMFEAVSDMLRDLISPVQFRAEAIERAPEGGDASAYPVSAPAFRAAVNPAAWPALQATLEDIGAMAEATSATGAALLLTHARTLRDIPRLRLVAEAGGDRAVAAAKRAPRDGRLADSAPGQLRFTMPLIIALSVAGAAALGLIWSLLTLIWVTATPLFQRMRERDESQELVQNFSAPWRVL